jgi:hypothetical protein
MPDGPAMPFPFLPWGVVVAGVVLGGMVGLFMFVVHLLDRAATEVSGTMLPGLVRGVRKWSDGPRSGLSRPSSPVAVDPESSLDPIFDEPLPARERLHPHIR